MSNDFELPKKSTGKKPAPTLPETSLEDLTSVETDKVDEPSTPKYDPDELMAIFDQMIFSGSYSETVNLKGKFSVAFRTRTAEEVEEISRSLDTTTINMMTTLVEKRSLFNLHYALLSYGGRDLSGLKQTERVAFINKLAAPVVGMLIQGLSKFDQKVYEAFKDAEENF